MRQFSLTMKPTGKEPVFLGVVDVNVRGRRGVEDFFEGTLVPPGGHPDNLFSSSVVVMALAEALESGKAEHFAIADAFSERAFVGRYYVENLAELADGIAWVVALASTGEPVVVFDQEEV